MTDVRGLQAEFWKGFEKNFDPAVHGLSRRKPERNAMNFGMDIDYGNLTARFSPGAQEAGPKIEAELTLFGAKGAALCDKLKATGADRLEELVGRVVKFSPPPAKSRAGTVSPEWHVLVNPDVSPENRSEWPKHYKWLAEMILKLRDLPTLEFGEPSHVA